MSGGSMDYIYSRLEWSIPTKEKIDEYIENYGGNAQETKDLAHVCIDKLHEAVIIAKELEWFMSADTGPESFKRRLEEKLKYDLLKKPA